MADNSNTRKITILLDESLIEELRGWLTVNNGEIVKVEKPRKKKQPTAETQENHSDEEQPSTFDELQREVVEAEENREGEFCTFCRNAPCVILANNLPARLKAHGQPVLTNHSKRKGDYKTFYAILKRRGLWRDPVYLQRKEALGCYIQDVREVMPICVVEDVRRRWPNPEGVPYCGHRRS